MPGTALPTAMAAVAVLGMVLASPLKLALKVRDPSCAALVWQVASPPVTGMPVQPVTGLPPRAKSTVPVMGPVPEASTTEARSVTGWPIWAGSEETVRKVATLPTFSVIGTGGEAM